MSAPLRVLCLDIEGGHGGSSRSLIQSLLNLDRELISPEVICRRSGEFQDIYRAVNIPCRVFPELPKVSSLPRFSRNLIVYSRFLFDFLRARPLLLELVREINERFDLVHFNHEGYWLLAKWLRPRVSAPFTMHLRTNLQDTVFGRTQERTIGNTMDRLVYITENEQISFERLGGRCDGQVINNIAAEFPQDTLPHPDIPCDSRFKIACLSNFGWNRGTDRLVEMAQALAGLGRRDILFVVAGDMELSRSLPGVLGEIGGRGGTLGDYAMHCGVGDMFLFLGHVSNPEMVLKACDLVAKPTREANPWGRDIIEAMSAGKPVFSVGTWNGFVLNNKTGLLQEKFEPDNFASEIVRLIDKPEAFKAMGAAGKEHIHKLCSGPERAAELANLWRTTAGEKAD
jgi:glycosyltransferase involved in cell wall biosynthesis